MMKIKPIESDEKSKKKKKKRKSLEEQFEDEVDRWMAR